MISGLFDALIRRRLRKSAQPIGGYRPKAVACWTCNIPHQLPPDVRQAIVSAEDFFYRHQGHTIDWLECPGLAGLPLHNSDVKQSFAAAITFTITSLNSLASSATAGWQSAVQTNTASLYLDALVMVVLSFSNIAPANSKAAFIYTYGGIASGTYTYPCTGTESALTLQDVTLNQNMPKRIATINYLVQNATIQGVPSPVGVAFGGALPPFWGLALINHSGAALNATGNSVSAVPTYLTVI